MNEKSITLDEIAIINNKFKFLTTKLIIYNQTVFSATKEFEKIFYKEIEELQNNLDVLKKRLEKEKVGQELKK